MFNERFGDKINNQKYHLACTTIFYLTYLGVQLNWVFLDLKKKNDSNKNP